jgi:hypothetical protein
MLVRPPVAPQRVIRMRFLRGVMEQTALLVMVTPMIILFQCR